MKLDYIRYPVHSASNHRIGGCINWMKLDYMRYPVYSGCNHRTKLDEPTGLRLVYIYLVQVHDFICTMAVAPEL